jgi:hypothetical protein
VSPGTVQLSAQQRRSLERDGYLLVPSLLDDTVIARMASRLTELVRQTVAAWAADPARTSPSPVSCTRSWDWPIPTSRRAATIRC